MIDENPIIDNIRQKWVMRNRDQVELVNRSINLLSNEIYSTDGRVFEELIQNADDNTYPTESHPKLFFYLENSNTPILWMAMNECGLTDENVKSICSLAESTKSNDKLTIGEKGIGFKSVFRITQTPQIYSKQFSFSLSSDPDPEVGVSFIVPRSIQPIPDHYLKSFSILASAVINEDFNSTSFIAGTIMRFPLKDSSVQKVNSAITGATGASLVFLRKLHSITYITSQFDPYFLASQLNKNNFLKLTDLHLIDPQIFISSHIKVVNQVDSNSLIAAFSNSSISISSNSLQIIENTSQPVINSSSYSMLLISQPSFDSVVLALPIDNYEMAPSGIYVGLPTLEGFADRMLGFAVNLPTAHLTASRERLTGDSIPQLCQQTAETLAFVLSKIAEQPSLFQSPLVAEAELLHWLPSHAGSSPTERMMVDKVMSRLRSVPFLPAANYFPRLSQLTSPLTANLPNDHSNFPFEGVRSVLKRPVILDACVMSVTRWANSLSLLKIAQLPSGDLFKGSQWMRPPPFTNEEEAKERIRCSADLYTYYLTESLFEQQNLGRRLTEEIPFIAVSDIMGANVRILSLAEVANLKPWIATNISPSTLTVIQALSESASDLGSTTLVSFLKLERQSCVSLEFLNYLPAHARMHLASRPYVKELSAHELSYTALEAIASAVKVSPQLVTSQSLMQCAARLFPALDLSKQAPPVLLVCSPTEPTCRSLVLSPPTIQESSVTSLPRWAQFAFPTPVSVAPLLVLDPTAHVALPFAVHPAPLPSRLCTPPPSLSSPAAVASLLLILLLPPAPPFQIHQKLLDYLKNTKWVPTAEMGVVSPQEATLPHSSRGSLPSDVSAEFAVVSREMLGLLHAGSGDASPYPLLTSSESEEATFTILTSRLQALWRFLGVQDSETVEGVVACIKNIRDTAIIENNAKTVNGVVRLTAVQSQKLLIAYRSITSIFHSSSPDSKVRTLIMQEFATQCLIPLPFSSKGEIASSFVPLRTDKCIWRDNTGSGLLSECMTEIYHLIKDEVSSPILRGLCLCILPEIPPAIVFFLKWKKFLDENKTPNGRATLAAEDCAKVDTFFGSFLDSLSMEVAAVMASGGNHALEIANLPVVKILRGCGDTFKFWSVSGSRITDRIFHARPFVHYRTQSSNSLHDVLVPSLETPCLQVHSERVLLALRYVFSLVPPQVKITGFQIFPASHAPTSTFTRQKGNQKVSTSSFTPVMNNLSTRVSLYHLWNSSGVPLQSHPVAEQLFGLTEATRCMQLRTCVSAVGGGVEVTSHASLSAAIVKQDGLVITTASARQDALRSADRLTASAAEMQSLLTANESGCLIISPEFADTPAKRRQLAHDISEVLCLFIKEIAHLSRCMLPQALINSLCVILSDCLPIAWTFARSQPSANLRPFADEDIWIEALEGLGTGPINARGLEAIREQMVRENYLIVSQQSGVVNHADIEQSLVVDEEMHVCSDQQLQHDVNNDYAELNSTVLNHLANGVVQKNENLSLHKNALPSSNGFFKQSPPQEIDFNPYFSFVSEYSSSMETTINRYANVKHSSSLLTNNNTSSSPVYGVSSQEILLGRLGEKYVFNNIMREFIIHQLQEGNKYNKEQTHLSEWKQAGTFTEKYVNEQQVKYGSSFYLQCEGLSLGNNYVHEFSLSDGRSEFFLQ